MQMSCLDSSLPFLQRVPRVKQYQEGTRTSDGSIDPSSMDVRHGMQVRTHEVRHVMGKHNLHVHVYVCCKWRNRVTLLNGMSGRMHTRAVNTHVHAFNMHSGLDIGAQDSLSEPRGPGALMS